ncbi:MAG: TSUP family transporter [Planctomycetota bacterium]
MLIVVLLLSVFVTAIISGIFGMAGGLILMGIYAALLPVPTAMMLHGITQLAANGSRTWFLRRHIEWRAVRRYAWGCAFSVVVLAALTIVLPAPILFLALGGIPLVVGMLPKRVAPSIDTVHGAVTCGLLVTAAQLLAGASGPLLDVFYVRSRLDRHAIVATKAFTQSMGHALKLIYFGWVVPAAGLGELPSWIVPAVMTAALVGTHVGARLLDRLSDDRFRSWSAGIVRVLGVIFVARGIAALT